MCIVEPPAIQRLSVVGRAGSGGGGPTVVGSKAQSLSLPPHVSDAFPVHGVSHSESAANAVALVSALPQQHWWPASTPASKKLFALHCAAHHSSERVSQPPEISQTSCVSCREATVSIMQCPGCLAADAVRPKINVANIPLRGLLFYTSELYVPWVFVFADLVCSLGMPLLAPETVFGLGVLCVSEANA